MNLPAQEYPFIFLSACFSGTWQGKESQQAELRVPAIRGHLRLWHRALYRHADANRVWGSTAGNDGSGSRVGVTLKNLPAPGTTKADTLPHKENAFHRGPRAALPAGTKATLILQRLPGCTGTDWDHAQKAARLWLLLGSLGYRSNRAAGSVWPDGTTAPANPAALRQELTSLGCNWAINLAPTVIGTTWEPLREAASDTPNVPATYGAARPRTPSPTHLKIVRFGSELRLIIFAQSSHTLASAKTDMQGKLIPALSRPAEWMPA